jgi:hypothetical protein
MPVNVSLGIFDECLKIILGKNRACAKQGEENNYLKPEAFHFAKIQLIMRYLYTTGKHGRITGNQ